MANTTKKSDKSYLQEGHRGSEAPAPTIRVTKEPVSAVPPAPAPKK
jgi:hypothetical protein